MDSEGKTNVVPPEKAETQKIGPAGSTVAGTDFSIQPPAQAPHSRIKSLKIQGGWAIDKIQVQYENLATHPPEIYNSLALVDPGGSASLFDLENDDYLVAVSGSWGAQASGYPKEEIITLQFNTHHGKQSQVFGGGNPQKQVEPFLFTAPAGYAIVGFFGASGSHQNCLVRLGVYLQPVQQEIRVPRVPCWCLTDRMTTWNCHLQVFLQAVRSHSVFGLTEEMPYLLIIQSLVHLMPTEIAC